jgi:hypothetical protein
MLMPRSSAGGGSGDGGASGPGGGGGITDTDGTNGDYSVEDAEVARAAANVAAGDAVGGDAGGDSQRNTPSPVIIWRHAAPVKIATNVPADLLLGSDAAKPTTRQRGSWPPSSPGSPGAELEEGGAGGAADTMRGVEMEEAPERVVAARARAVNRLAARAQAARHAATEIAANDATEEGRRAYNRRMAYGVWYLPKEQWEARAQAAGEGGLAAAALDKPGGAPKAKERGERASGKGRGRASQDAAAAAGGDDGDSKGGAASEGDGQSLAETIPKLYSSRIYKDFLKGELNMPAARIPRYLAGVESS